MKDSALLSDNLYYCEHLTITREVIGEIDSFVITKPNGKGLMDYLQVRAHHDENQGKRRVYLVRDADTDELAAFFGLRAGLMTTGEHKDPYQNDKIVFETLPGIELSELAMNEAYLDKHPSRKGTGLTIYKHFVLPLAKMAAQYVGAEILYGFSVDNSGRLLNKYLTEYGFSRLEKEEEQKLHNRLRPYYDNNCTFIYRRL